MYKVLTKKQGSKEFKTIRKFEDYKKCYRYVGSRLQRDFNLHWSYSLKYLLEDFDKTKIFKYGDTFIEIKKTSFRIEQTN